MAAMTRADAIADATREDAIVTSRLNGTKKLYGELEGIVAHRVADFRTWLSGIRVFEDVFLFDDTLIDVVPLIWRTVA